MNITITIPDDKKDAVIDAFALQYKYQDTIENTETGEQVPNPVKKGAFALNIVKAFIKEVYVGAQIKPIEETKTTILETAMQEMDSMTVE